MKKTLIILLASVSIISCEKNETKVSTYAQDESHLNGQNCMECHVKGGDGEGRFTVAGSVYDSLKINAYPKALIELYSEANAGGSLVGSIEVDSKGNFYTTKDIDFGSGLFPTVIGTSGNQKHMSFKVTEGSCNTCHGVSTSKLWAE